jgi:3-deoxy-D-manno-octulosonic-acid transferase
MLLIYTILYSLVLFVIFPFEYFRRPRSLRARWLRERFGVFKSQPAGTTSNKKAIWIHAVSVGEAATAVCLVKKIKALYPGIDIFISTVTDTGQKVAAERLGHLAKIIYVPFDLPGCISGAIKNISPSLFMIMETELWPNIIHIMKKKGIPVLLMNGRISEKSFKGYSKAGFFINGVLRDITMFCMQEELYAGRIRLLGASPDKVIVTGNFKFDIQPVSGMPEWTRAFKFPTIIAGSTHRTEEDIVLDAYEELLKNVPDLNLILAPRHPERFGEVEEILIRRNIRYIKRSKIKAGAEEQKAGLVVLLDVIGELATSYGAADIAVIGGSFIAHGGQNPLEPAYWGRAIVCGPHMENFPFMDEFYSKGAALQAEPSTLVSVLSDLLHSEKKRAVIGMTARELYKENTGATERTMEIAGRYI